MVGYASEALFLLRAMQRARGLPESPVAHVLGGPEVQSITVANLHGETWFGPIGSYAIDIASLCLLCRILKPSTVFEIGTLHGFTTLHFALNTPPDATIYTLDLPKSGAPRPALSTTVVDDDHIRASTVSSSYIFGDSPVAGKIKCLFGDSATFDFSPYHGRVGLFFIDGAHSYEYVRSDTLNALRCCAAGGVIAWHDFGRMGVNGVTRWLREMAGSGRTVYAVPGGSLAFMRLE
ncbi:MAG: hypothetical protein A2X52_12430 [Candidatus Rokubacteria bacterium GWC2_70_16]|nr:MAG: hypothetical protein A2X52_12430 [Candidatus Rokubacteria bacterium GWC2_70_16]